MSSAQFITVVRPSRKQRRKPTEDNEHKPKEHKPKDRPRGRPVPSNATIHDVIVFAKDQKQKRLSNAAPALPAPPAPRGRPKRPMPVSPPVVNFFSELGRSLSGDTAAIA